MTEAHHGHDPSDRKWSLPEPHLPRHRGCWGGVARDNRRFLDAVLWILRTGAPWRDLPLRAIAAAGATADCRQADVLIEGVDAGALLSDRAHDTNQLLAHCRRRGIEPVIPSKRNRKVQRQHDRQLYRQRHRVENAFLHFRC